MLNNTASTHHYFQRKAGVEPWNTIDQLVNYHAMETVGGIIVQPLASDREIKVEKLIKVLKVARHMTVFGAIRQVEHLNTMWRITHKDSEMIRDPDAYMYAVGRRWMSKINRERKRRDVPA